MYRIHLLFDVSNHFCGLGNFKTLIVQQPVLMLFKFVSGNGSPHIEIKVYKLMLYPPIT